MARTGLLQESDPSANQLAQVQTPSLCCYHHDAFCRIISGDVVMRGVLAGVVNTAGIYETLPKPPVPKLPHITDILWSNYHQGTTKSVHQSLNTEDGALNSSEADKSYNLDSEMTLNLFPCSS